MPDAQTILRNTNPFSFRLYERIQLKSDLSIEVEQSQEGYRLKQDNITALARLIEPDMGDKLKRLLADKEHPCLGKVLQQTEETVYICITVFSGCVEWNSYKRMEIGVDLQSYADKWPIDRIKNTFTFDGGTKAVAIEDDKTSGIFILLSQDAKGVVYTAKVINENGTYMIREINSRYQPSEKPLFLHTGAISFVKNPQYIVTKEMLDDITRMMRRGDAYLAIWDKYNQLEKYSIYLDIAESGILEYVSFSSTTSHEGQKFRFSLKENRELNLRAGEAFLACTDDQEILQINDSSIRQDPEKMDQVFRMLLGKHRIFNVGRVFPDSMKGRSITTVSTAGYDLEDRVPETGYLFFSPTGDNTRLNRREAARKAIAEFNTPLSLAAIIESGKTTGDPLFSFDAVNKGIAKIEKRLGRPFTPSQQNAIHAALQSPDIAVIQGPPGTGKTRVLRAIVDIFKELCADKEKVDPKILITSYQHDAVENAIEGADYGGLPINKVGSKHGKEESTDDWTRNIEEWSEQTRERLDAQLASIQVSDIHSLRRDLCNEILIWKGNGRPEDAGREIISRYYQREHLKFHEMSCEIESILASTNQDEQASVDMRFLELVESQRLTKEGFLQYAGPEQVIRLYKHVKRNQHDEVNQDILLSVQDMDDIDLFDESTFQVYVDHINALREGLEVLYNAKPKQTNSDRLDEILMKMVKRCNVLDLFNTADPQAIKKDIIGEYRDGISDLDEVKELVRKYSQLIAGTCQQIASKYLNTYEGAYDLVLIDEAARANPLDLFIPMARARKIVMLGDHKQLPHMIEEDVVKKLQEMNKEDELSLLKTSFLEFMFDKLGKNIEPSIVRTAMLTEQFRMHPVIGNFVSKTFYNNELSSDMVDVEQRKLSVNLFENKPVSFINIPASAGGENKRGSVSRRVEAQKIREYIGLLSQSGLKLRVGVITFYSAQVKELQVALNTYTTGSVSLEIGTVDSFQGKEFDIVFLSCVRSNPKGDVGFVKDTNRLCVSFSRAKSMLVCVGDLETLKNVQSIVDFSDLCKSEGYYV